MTKYAILANPGHNRVYFEASKVLSVSELTLALQFIHQPSNDIKLEELASVPYITFTLERPLIDSELCVLARLSFIYAIFMVEEMDGKNYLCPIVSPNYKYINSSISTIMKYSGKTNELFTRMMMNVALFSCTSKDIASALSGASQDESCATSNESINLLDPIAGKGTTLFEGLVCGYNVHGIEIAEKVVEESHQFIRKYLESEKYKHTSSAEKLIGDRKSFTAKRYVIDIARDKNELKNKNTRQLQLISGNAMYADKFFKKNYFHMIVGDLPYGVQHGNVSMQKVGGAPTRSPRELITYCAPAWFSVLKSGGCMVLAWNSFVYSREEFSRLLTKFGFVVQDEPVFSTFEHRVDQAIRRDIIVAKKP